MLLKVKADARVVAIRVDIRLGVDEVVAGDIVNVADDENFLIGFPAYRSIADEYCNSG